MFIDFDARYSYTTHPSLLVVGEWAYGERASGAKETGGCRNSKIASNAYLCVDEDGI